MVKYATVMTYKAIFRGKDGRQDAIILEASSRAEVFAELKRRGISAIRVEETTGGRRSASSRRAAAAPRAASSPSLVRGLAAGAIAVVIAALSAWFVFSNRSPSLHGDSTKRPAKITDVASISSAGAAVVHAAGSAKSAKEIAAEYGEKAREFIKKAVTNETQWIVPPLDPNDPDNALRTRVCQELGSLLSIEPGEPMPPFPYSFLLEDDMREAEARGEDVGEIDNGNKNFLDSIAKFKIVAKETDDDHRLEHKEKLIAAQGELLEALDDGLSVNDSIRAAYEFRKRAYEMRTELSSLLQEIASEEATDIHMFKEQLEMANAKLKEEGIKTIPIEEILPDYEAEADETAEVPYGHPKEEPYGEPERQDDHLNN